VVVDLAFKIIELNRPVQQITVPAELLAWLLLIPLRGQKPCQKQAVIPDWGRSETK